MTVGKVSGQAHDPALQVSYIGRLGAAKVAHESAILTLGHGSFAPNLADDTSCPFFGVEIRSGTFLYKWQQDKTGRHLHLHYYS